MGVSLAGGRGERAIVLDSRRGLLWAVNPVSGLIYYRVDDTTLRWRNPTTDEYGDFPQFPGLDTQIAATCAVSPDGKLVAYSSNPPQTNTAETTFVSGLTTYIARSDGSDPVRIDMSDHGKRLTPVQWHPHEHKLLVERDDGRQKFYEMSRSEAVEMVGLADECIRQNIESILGCDIVTQSGEDTDKH